MDKITSVFSDRYTNVSFGKATSPVVLGSCPICQSSFPQGKVLDRHVDMCLSAASGGGAAPPPALTSASGSGASFGSSSMSNAASQYAPQDLEADILQAERVLERIIRSVDPLPVDFHIHVEPLYQRLSLCLEGSSKRIKLYSGYAAATSMGGGSMPASLTSAGSRASSSSSSFASSPSSLPATIFPSSSASSASFGGGKGEAAQHPSAAHYPPSGFVEAGAPPSYIDEDANERAFMELMRAEGSCSICDQQVGAENLRVEACTRDADHRYCTPCLQKEFADRLAGAKPATFACPVRGCGNENLSRGTLRLAMSDEQIERIETMQLQRFMSQSDSFVTCPNAKCGYAFERMTNQKVASVSSATGATAEQGLDGKPLSAEAIVHRDRSRYRCPQCAENFCAECRAAPYHLGYTCTSFETYQSAKHCRFCETALTRANTSRGGGAGVSGLVCTDDECQEKKKLACGKVLACTHPCCGIKGEDPCLPCLEEECQTGSVCKEDYCNICYTEGLGSAPTIRIACGHMFHLTCVQLKLRKRWTGSRITFGFLNCPLCKQQIDHPALRSELEPMLKLLEDIRGKAQQRLKIEGNDKDAAVCEPSGRYFRRPIDYAMDKFAYYPCFKCKQPYFGGQRQCEAGQPEAAAAAGANGREAAEDFDASHLVCGGCADAGQECKAHGKEFIEWKCKFCCNISNWYCWGNTHFCESCHKRQVAGDYMTKKKPSELPACPGAATCPLKGVHPAPGTEVCLGCALCRNSANF